MAKKTTAPPIETPKKKQSRVSQSDIPKYGFRDCRKLAQTLHDEFNGKATPHQLAIAFGSSPTSSAWQYITGASVAYGLTQGAYNAQAIELGEFGRRIVAPTEEGDEVKATVEAALKPRIISEFFQKYNRGKFPSDKIAENVLETMGVPRDRVSDVLSMIKEIGDETGIVHITKTGPYVALDSPAPKVSGSGSEKHQESEETGEDASEGDMEAFAKSVSDRSPAAEMAKPEIDMRSNRVFITHGKNHDIVTQLKELLTFGKFEPVVSVEKETLSVPVPEKVMQDMRSCGAAVIHVAGEGEVMDSKGNKLIHINPNVLIEIGAAMALYDKNFVLLVHKGVQLPSNLQGLYRCEYEGETLDYQSTMKLLKTFNQFK